MEASELTAMVHGRAESAFDRAHRDEIAAFRVLWAYLAPERLSVAADVIFCFGSRDHSVPHAAARLHRTGVAPRVLVTGGSRGRTGRHATEADAFAAILGARGVPRSRTVLERRAFHTAQNVALGMAALAEQGVEVGAAALVAWPLAMRRCCATFAQLFPDVLVTPRPAQRFPAPCDAHPRLADHALGELRRLRDYAALGWIAEQQVPGAVCEAEELLATRSRRSSGLRQRP